MFGSGGMKPLAPIPPKLLFDRPPTGGPSWCCSALSPRAAPPGPLCRGGTGFGGGTIFSCWLLSAERAGGRSDRRPDTAELAACETVGVLETFWLKLDPAVTSRIVKPQRILMLDIERMIRLRPSAHLFCAS